MQPASRPYETARSWWREVSPKGAGFPALQGVRRADVAVIGGGFTGLSAALHLARGGASVVLLEGRAIGWGGSGRNNGQVIPVLTGVEPDWIEARFGDVGARFVGLVRDSAETLFRLAEAEGIDCEAEQSGWFQPAHAPAFLKVSAARNAAWAARGAPCRMLDKRECDALLGSPAWHGGMLNPTGGHINPLMLAHGLARACAGAGVELHEASPVQEMQRAAGQWRLRCGQGEVRCDAVLLATGAYGGVVAGGLAPQVARSVVPVTSWQMVTEPLSPQARAQILPGRQAVSDTRGDLRYFRLDARDRLVTGAAMMLPLNAGPRLSRLVGGRLARAFPALGRVRFSHVWSGYVGITPDRFPQFFQPQPGLFSASGFNGRGVALSVSAGREMARVMAGGPAAEAALPFSTPKPVPFHPLARRLARSALLLYRWRDWRGPG